MNSVISIMPSSKALIASVQCREFDHGANERLKQEVYDAAATTSGLPLILDLSRVTFIASSTLGALVELRNKFSKDGRRMALTGVSPDILKVMKTCSIQGLFEVHDTVENALA
jgi:anti-anti-sigma factor